MEDVDMIGYTCMQNVKITKDLAADMLKKIFG